MAALVLTPKWTVELMKKKVLSLNIVTRILYPGLETGYRFLLINLITVSSPDYII